MSLHSPMEEMDFLAPLFPEQGYNQVSMPTLPLISDFLYHNIKFQSNIQS